MASTDTLTVTAADRLGLTLFFAIVLHAIVILGVTFSPDVLESLQDKHAPLEITLVHQRSDAAPEKADFLAQANLQGGGDTDEKVRPSSPESTPINPPKPGLTTQLSLPTAPPQPTEPTMTVLTQDHATTQLNQKIAPDKPQKEAVSAEELVALSMEIAHLSAEINRNQEAYSKRLRQRWIASSAREFRDATYLDTWRGKIERIGNLNYPEEAKRRKITGSLMLDVALTADGGIYEITLLQSSGHKILDDAAVRIVRLAAPFAPFPEELRKDTDILHITRTWQFLESNQFTAAQ